MAPYLLGICLLAASTSSLLVSAQMGATLLLEHWFAISPAISALVLNAACYLFGWRTLGKDFLLTSIFCGAAYSVFYALMEPFAPLWPGLVASPVASAIVGAVFIGVGAGLCVRVGGAPGGDDALAMALARLTKLDIQWIYLFTDVVVLGLSVTYIPPAKIGWSLLTVILSGQIIGLVQKIGIKRKQPRT